jgi:hypothetical protein
MKQSDYVLSKVENNSFVRDGQVQRGALEYCDKNMLQIGCLIPFALLHLGQAVALVLVLFLVVGATRVVRAVCTTAVPAFVANVVRRRPRRGGDKRGQPTFTHQDFLEL